MRGAGGPTRKGAAAAGGGAAKAGPVPSAYKAGPMPTHEFGKALMGGFLKGAASKPEGRGGRARAKSTRGLGLPEAGADPNGKAPEAGPGPRKGAAPKDADMALDAEASYVEGRNAVLEALRGGRTVEKVYVAKGESEGRNVRIASLARKEGIPVIEADKRKIESMSATGSSQGIIAITSEVSYVEVGDILAIAEDRGEPPFLLVLEGIQDPRNLGSMIRTALCAGVHGIILPKRNACGVTAAVAKASAGAVEHMAMAKVANIASTLEALKKAGVWVVGLDVGGESDYRGHDHGSPTAVVIGGEGEGMGRLVKERCDYTVRIPVKGAVSSLNAGVAAALALYEVLRSREP
ncbi:MAG: 23S rRNA (guanosine(2251)-2'-O)-methyltransferase RlmB [Oscillospiraceae bacterium]|nr:23S rRNA (guanosine(2251)-2'-O)-methyltransferase RlmB [Oscillospiraceae bacterium]